MTLLHRDCVLNCAGAPFDFANERVASCDDLPHVAAGSNVTMTGTGTAADPYTFSAPAPTPPATGAETKVQAGANVAVTGSGTTADPYVIAAATPTGAETKVQAGANVTVTGSGTTADPYVVAAATPTGAETKVQAGTNTTVTGAGTVASPYVVNAGRFHYDVQRGAQTYGPVAAPVGGVISQVGPVTLTNPSATNSMLATSIIEPRDTIAIATTAGTVILQSEYSTDAGVTWTPAGQERRLFTAAGADGISLASSNLISAFPASASQNMWARVRVIANTAGATVQGNLVLTRTLVGQVGP